jgi:REP element-mobilizing transposase RayT
MNEDILAFFITWTCYGTFLPGDGRGWTKWSQGEQLPQPRLEEWCRRQMAGSAVRLDSEQREIVNEAVKDHCEIREWLLHAVNCRSNHCHVVVGAENYKGDQVRDQFKAWSTRRLKAHQRSRIKATSEVRNRWWTSKGSVQILSDEISLDAATMYTLEAQDLGGSNMG